MLTLFSGSLSRFDRTKMMSRCVICSCFRWLLNKKFTSIRTIIGNGGPHYAGEKRVSGDGNDGRDGVWPVDTPPVRRPAPQGPRGLVSEALGLDQVFFLLFLNQIHFSQYMFSYFFRLH